MKEHTNINDLKDQIAALEKEKKQLLKLVSHDVKSPFNKLFALSNLLQLVSENLNEEQLDYLMRMEWVIKEGLTVVRNLMDLRAIDNNTVDVSPEELSVDLLLKEIINGYTKQIKSKNLELDLKIDKVTNKSDKRLVEKIVDNLISNAVKFTPKSTCINVSLSSSKNIIQLQVSSKSGPIPSEETIQLFKRSSPLSTRPTHGESALGNGLFIAQNYANKLGATILFHQNESEVSFKLELPQRV